MHAQIFNILNSCALINLTFLLNYILWYLGLGNFAATISLCLFSGTVIYLFFVSFRYNFDMWPITIFILFLAIISLSTPTIAWDARSIWLFHAKRIFIDQNIFAQMDNYAPWSHNDYPVIIPTFSASLATIIGLWNEIFPKIVNIIFLIPPLFLFGIVLRKRLFIMIFLIGIIFLCHSQLYNGFVDANLSLYMLPCIFLTLEAYQKKDSLLVKENIIYILSISLCWSVAVMIKNEGILLFTIFVFALSIYNIFEKKISFKILAYLLCLPILFIASWKIVCLNNNIFNDLTNSALINQLHGRIFLFENYKLIFKYLFHEFWVLGMFILIGSLFFNRNKFNYTVLFILTFQLLYVSALFLTYLATPNNLIWHLNTSASRTILPVNVIMFGSLIYLLKYVIHSTFGVVSKVGEKEIYRE